MDEVNKGILQAELKFFVKKITANEDRVITFAPRYTISKRVQNNT